jgi:serine/threonine protein kinase
MGEVYKAMDTRLNRTVAIKILPEHISQNPEAKQRLDREAKAIAALKHPNICVLFDVGQQDGIDFLVMEHLDGTTLAQRLSHGALPLAEAMKVASEIVDALDKAHKLGVVHRDLKPGNIMLTSNGTKLLDFGLAKVGTERPAAQAAPSAAPTGEAPLTRDGVILGTLQYMAPEQVEGQEADARTDIFALGAVLYEMVTGRRAFQGKSQPSLIASILSTNPPSATSLTHGIPPALDHVIERCLAKEPSDRWQSARDVWMELKWVTDSSKHSERVPVVEKRRRKWLIPAAVSIAILAMAAASLLYFRRAPVEPVAAEKRFQIPVVGLASPYYISISPDGRRVAYNAATSSGRTAIWVRPIDSLDAKMLPGTEGASPPDWSPDGSFVVFAVDGKVKKMNVAEGGPQTLADLGVDVQGRFTRSAWSPNGTIIFAVNDGKGLRRVFDSGGDVVEVTTLDRSLEQSAHSTPWFLPDGRHFLFTAWSAKPENRALYVGSIDSKDVTRLMASESKGVYVKQGFILFLRDRALMARPFDPTRLEFTGEAVRLAEAVAYNPTFGQSAFYPSNEGSLIYYQSTSDVLPSGSRQSFWTDRSGKTSDPLKSTLLGGTAMSPRLSPNGKFVAFHEGLGGSTDIFVYDIERDLRTRLTTDPGADAFPVWSPNNERIVFASSRNATRGGRDAIYEKPANGAVAENVLATVEASNFVTRDWSPDGKLLIVEMTTGSAALGDRRIWTVPVDGERKPVQYLNTQAMQPALSPNGKWMAYVSNESGSTSQVIVQPFPDPSKGKWQVSSTGGLYPRWKRDGRELYYLDRDRRIVAVSVTAGETFELGKSTPLFTTAIPFSLGVAPDIPYDVTADGQRFLITASLAQAPGQNTTLINVILNWPSILKR